MQVETRQPSVMDDTDEPDRRLADKPRTKKRPVESRAHLPPMQDVRAHLAAIVESSEDAIISKSLDGTILSWNKAAERMLGYAASDIVGCSIRVLIPPDRQEEETALLRRLQENEARIEYFSTVRLTRDGGQLDVMVSLSPIRDGSGRIIGASKILRPLTEEQLAEQSVRDSEARLRCVVDSASEAIITLTELGGIESVNKAGLATFGFSREELVGQNIKVLIPDLSPAEPDGSVAALRRLGDPKIIGIGGKVTGRRKNGSFFPMDLAMSEVQLADGKLYTIIARDITQREEVEMALVEAKETAEAASRTKEHFLSVLSHELRTPLTPALAELSVIEEDAGLSLDMRNRLKMVRRNIETEARLVDDLLDITRITQGKIHLRYELVDLHETVRAALAMFQAEIDAKSLEIALALFARQLHVWADPGRIQQILLNLLSNAVKFTPACGRIAIRSSNDQAGQIEVEVSDSGVGIDPEMLPRLFNPFEQSERTRRLGGLGLGLSIARSLTELHLGKLTASSDGRDHGSVFRLTLATAAPAEHVPSTPKRLESPTIDQRILLVEDHNDTRLVLARLLRSLGCHVVAAASMREALAAAEAAKFDLLLSDIGLPDGSGLDLMQKLKSRIGRGIALSGYGQPEDLRRSFEAGFELHLTKPMNFNILKDALQHMVAND